ncbi:hypothetical protein K2Z83_18415 [Oscillochloris sp. ZM17-4]|uniref:hypothetical protein n=1 Tax=Oscillochloris sp. ZM17-4 TaxID=2866714 RepID=UPI001C73D523|nr:hypothetical protein [Oscillochloris sp. ZM17-4]MBX0329648.1 hypothetical protein [Oscillochloris sp. ZM17-4]
MSPRRGGGRAPWPGPRLAAVAGLIGPLYLGGTIVTLTLRQGAFLRALGWDPLRAPTVDWPSGLALSPEGGWMIAAFLISGGLLAILAVGLHHHLARSGPPLWGPRMLGRACPASAPSPSLVGPAGRRA